MKYALGLSVSLVAALTPCALGCGEDPALPPLFEPVPECEGDAVVTFAGDHQNVISTIEIGDLADGFDLDGDGDPDNKLAAVGSLARTPIEEALNEYELIIPFEFFDLPSVATDACIKFAIYLGAYKQDADADTEETSVDGGDCNDHLAAVRPGAAEDPLTRYDDDCDGLTNEVDDGNGNQVPPVDGEDRDGDGVTVGQGDCDDTAETGEWSTPGIVEVCGDGRDNDCSGVADFGPEATENCSPYDSSPNTIDLDPLSFTDGGDPVIIFSSGQINAGVLTAGPSIFSVNIPVIDGISLDLRITGAQIIADIVMDGDTVHLENGRLGGVIDAQTADNIRGLDVPDINLTPENSLLDAIFGNVLGSLLALPTAPVSSGHPQCRTPDIDVDRDGLEIFCDSDTDDDIKAVDLCIDGDGTVIMDTGSGASVVHCSAATLADGTPRFRDGISVELNFETVPTILRDPSAD